MKRLAWLLLAVGAAEPAVRLPPGRARQQPAAGGGDHRHPRLQEPDLAPAGRAVRHLRRPRGVHPPQPAAPGRVQAGRRPAAGGDDHRFHDHAAFLFRGRGGQLLRSAPDPRRAPGGHDAATRWFSRGAGWSSRKPTTPTAPISSPRKAARWTGSPPSSPPASSPPSWKISDARDHFLRLHQPHPGRKKIPAPAPALRLQRVPGRARHRRGRARLRPAAHRVQLQALLFRRRGGYRLGRDPGRGQQLQLLHQRPEGHHRGPARREEDRPGRRREKSRRRLPAEAQPAHHPDRLRLPGPEPRRLQAAEEREARPAAGKPGFAAHGQHRPRPHRRRRDPQLSSRAT